jgi:hypothetical protein
MEGYVDMTNKNRAASRQLEKRNYKRVEDLTLEISALRLILFNEIEGVGLSINAPLGGLEFQLKII